MICSNCRETKRVPTHTTNLTIGIVSVLSNTVYVFVKNLATDYTYRQEVITEADGTVILDMAQPHYSYYHENASYQLWITDTDNELLEITIDNEINECLYVGFKNLYTITVGEEESVEYTAYEIALK